MSVLSLRRSVAALDERADRALMQSSLVQCIEAVSQYAVELNPASAAELRDNLGKMATRAGQLGNSAETEQLQADFRGELREYRDRSQAEVTRMRADLARATESLQCLIRNLYESGQDPGQALRQEFDRLEVTARSNDIDAIRAAIQCAAQTARELCDTLRRQQELIIAQLQEEIRELHREVDQERRAVASDAVTGLWNRAKADARIKDLMLLNEEFCVFFIGIVGLAEIGRQDTRLVAGFLQALGGRLHQLSGQHGESGLAARWSEDAFALIFNLPLASTPISAEGIARRLSGGYAVQLDGSAHRITAVVRVKTATWEKDGEESTFFMKLGRAAFDAVSP